MYRFHPQNQRARQMVLGGALGDVQMMSSTFSFAIRPGNEDNVRLQKDLAGGPLMDVGCHCINAMRFITGEEPARGTAFADFSADHDVDERIAAVLEFPSGTFGHLDASLRLHSANTYEVRGAKGHIQLRESFVPDYISGKPTHIHYWHGDSYETIEIQAANHYTLMAEDFADALLNSRPPRFDPQDGVDNMRVIDMLLQSARANQRTV